MQLFFREYGQGSAATSPLLLLHGLLGSSANWHSIARRLQARHHVIVPDLRNHGRSPHSRHMGYPEMAADIEALLDRLDAANALLVGHSMGAKAAMWLALNRPERVAAVAAVDMAPVAYPDRFRPLLATLAALDLQALRDRIDADRILSRQLDNRALRQYLLQNLVRKDGHWAWRMNLPVLSAATAAIADFPAPPPGRRYPGPSLFIYGSRSDYVRPEFQPVIQRLFPHARLRPLPDAGHWLYSERPDELLSALAAFVG